jgi:hypothetical protein
MDSKKSVKAQKNPGIWEYNLAEHKTGIDGLLSSGNPAIVKSPYGNAVLFNGMDDGYFLETNPLKDLTAFTIEVLIRPDLNGPEEQRFIHIGDIQGDRVLIETRLTKEGQWFLDTYIQSGQNQKTLIDPKFVHPVGPWYHVALTLDKDGNMTNYVNGNMEIKGQVDFLPINTGEMSMGVRRNKVSWYKGAIYKIKITPGVLDPAEFISL